MEDKPMNSTPCYHCRSSNTEVAQRYNTWNLHWCNSCQKTFPMFLSGNNSVSVDQGGANEMCACEEKS